MEDKVMHAHQAWALAEARRHAADRERGDSILRALNVPPLIEKAASKGETSIEISMPTAQVIEAEIACRRLRQYGYSAKYRAQPIFHPINLRIDWSKSQEDQP